MDIKLLDSMADIAPEVWNALLSEDYPFARHEFLLALETSGSACAKTGWQPLHMLMENTGTPVAAMPLYLKTNSYGEYVFDWGWADAYQRHGIPYYPKLLSAIPFTPATGPRLLTQAADPSPLLIQCVSAIEQLAQERGLSSWHYLFPFSTDLPALEATALALRHGCQFHWFNQGYRDFQDFLDSFVSRKRKNIRKEREKMRQQGVEFERLEGPEISTEVLDHFYKFYQATYFKRGQRGYLKPSFFHKLLAQMPEQLMLTLAKVEAKPVGAALYFTSQNTLYGRYWGCFAEYDSVHFEACYYQGIEYCLEHGIQRFDPGAQGEHKVARGFVPVTTYSAHWIQHPEFRAAIGDFTQQEQQQMANYRAQMCENLPFRADIAYPQAIA